MRRSSRRLRDAGAVIIGKTNLHEFAFGTTSEESAFGPVRHPRIRRAVRADRAAARRAALALGHVLRRHRHRHRRIDSNPRRRLRHRRSEANARRVVLRGRRAAQYHTRSRRAHGADRCSTSALLYPGDEGRARVRGVAPAGGRLTFGVADGYFMEPLDADVRAAVTRARARAGDQRPRDHRRARSRHAEWTPDAYLHIVLPEAARFHAERLETHARSVFAGRAHATRDGTIRSGGRLRAGDAHCARRSRARSIRALDGCDALLLPALAMPAPPIGATTVEVGWSQTQPVRAAMLKLTQLFNMTGHPAIAIPAGDGADGLPRGLQLVGSSRPYRTSAGRRDRGRASDRRRTRIGRRRHRMNVRPILADVWLSRRDGLVHGWRMSDDVRRTRHVRYRRLFDHAEDRARVLPVDQLIARSLSSTGSGGSRRPRPIASFVRSSGDASGSMPTGDHGADAERLEQWAAAALADSDRFLRARPCDDYELTATA